MNSGQPAPSPRLLLVDDEYLIRVVGKELLATLGFQVELAADGAEALRLLSDAFPPDMVLLDFHLPDFTGPELVRQLKKKHPGLRILVASGYFSTREVAELEKAGADGMITKPFRLAELKTRIHEIFQKTSSTPKPD